MQLCKTPDLRYTGYVDVLKAEYYTITNLSRTAPLGRAHRTS